MAEKTGEEIIYVEPGLYTVGDEIFINVRTYQGGSLIVDESINNESGGISTFGSSPPSASSVWDWSKGSFKSNFTMKQRVFTNYRFTGYTSYKVKVTISDSGNKLTSGAFTVTAIQDNNCNGASYQAGLKTFSATINFGGCKAGEKLAFAVSKGNCGNSVTGTIKVFKQ